MSRLRAASSTGQTICVDGGYLSHFSHVADVAAHFWETVGKPVGD
jgi:hypothetical protein